jgi:hypothetical protein
MKTLCSDITATSPSSYRRQPGRSVGQRGHKWWRIDMEADKAGVTVIGLGLMGSAPSAYEAFSAEGAGR